MQPSILSQKAAARARRIAEASRSQPARPAEAASSSTTATVRTAAADAVERHLCDHYSRRPGIAPLCQAVAARLTALGVPTNENDVVISGSIQEARYVALRSLAAGKTVFVLAQDAADAAPYAAALQFAGATTVVLRDKAGLPVNAKGLLLIASHMYELQRLAQWAETHDLAVVADETSAPLDGYTPFAALAGMAQRTLTLGSFAAAPGLAAWQVSWFAGPKSLLAPVRDLKQSVTICTSAPSQYAALAAFRETISPAATKEQA